MTEECELIVKSATKMTDMQFAKLKKSAQSGKPLSLHNLEQKVDSDEDLLKNLNASDLTMKSNKTALNMEQLPEEQTQPSQKQEEPAVQEDQQNQS